MVLIGDGFFEFRVSCPIVDASVYSHRLQHNGCQDFSSHLAVPLPSHRRRRVDYRRDLSVNVAHPWQWRTGPSMNRLTQNRGWFLALAGTGVFGCCVCVGLTAFLLAPTQGIPYAEILTEPASTQSPRLVSSDTPDAPAVVAPSTATPTAVQGGLGLSETEWESSHARTGEDVVGAVYDDRFLVTFLDGRVASIEEQWTEANAISEAEVDVIATPLIPADARPVETYSPEGRPETTVRVFSSASLATAFSQDPWGGADAGTFTVQYNMRDGRVTRLIIALGNNP